MLITVDGLRNSQSHMIRRHHSSSYCLSLVIHSVFSHSNSNGSHTYVYTVITTWQAAFCYLHSFTCEYIYRVQNNLVNSVYCRKEWRLLNITKQRSLGHAAVSLWSAYCTFLWTAPWKCGGHGCKAMTRWHWSFCSGSWSSISKGKLKKQQGGNC